jgi:hypothetical protein
MMTMTPFFRGEDIEPILRQLEILEEESGLFNGSSTVLMPVFFKHRSQAIICSYFRRIMNYSAWTKAFSGSYPVIRIFRPVGYTRSNADIIRIKNHIVALYPKHNLVCKFRRGSGVRQEDSLLREVRAIRAAEKFNCFRTPRIIRESTLDNNGTAPVIWYEKLNLRPIDKRDKQVASLSFLHAILPWYEANGVTFRSPDPGNFSYEKLISFGWNDEETGLILRALEKISKCGGMMPVSWIHGDASYQNSFFGKNQEIIILDWEMSRTDYIIYDIYALFRKGGGEAILEEYKLWLDQFSKSTPGILDVNAQIRIVEVMLYLNFKKEYEYITSVKYYEEAMQILEIRKHKVLSSAKEIIEKLY